MKAEVRQQEGYMVKAVMRKLCIKFIYAGITHSYRPTQKLQLYFVPTFFESSSCFFS